MKACEGQLGRVFVIRLEVDDYIVKQKSPQKEICKKLRKIIKLVKVVKERGKQAPFLRFFYRRFSLSPSFILVTNYTI